MVHRRAITVALLTLIAAIGALLARAGASRTGDTPEAVVGREIQAKLKRPVVIAQDRNFDLGVMNPGDKRAHRFLIENKGTADLTLELASTTCKCTLADIKNTRIPPGGSDYIHMEWHAERPQFRFVQGATIRTNDPDVPLMELVGEGSVRTKLGTVPETAYMTDVPRNASRSVSLLLYSQAFTEVTVTKIDSSSPAISAEVASTMPSTSPPQETRFMRDLNITVQPQADAGQVNTVLTLHYVGRLPDGTQETGTTDVQASFDVVGDFSLTGRNVIGPVVMFGAVRQATGAKRQAYVHIRNATVDSVKLTPGRIKPEFLRVDVGQPQQLTPTMVRVPLAVEIPPGAPQIAHVEDEAAEIELHTGRAEQPTVRFRASFAIAP